jgi:hypothetical protein
MSRRGRIVTDRLTQALITMASKGLRPNCSDQESHWMWLSEHPAERAKAAEKCGGCCVIAECDAAAEANGERFGAGQAATEPANQDERRVMRPNCRDCCKAPQPRTDQCAGRWCACVRATQGLLSLPMLSRLRDSQGRTSRFVSLTPPRKLHKPPKLHKPFSKMRADLPTSPGSRSRKNRQK